MTRRTTIITLGGEGLLDCYRYMTVSMNAVSRPKGNVETTHTERKPSEDKVKRSLVSSAVRS